MMFKPLPVLTLCSAVSLAILLWLGNWQWARYSEKMARESAGPPAWEMAYISDAFPTPFQVRTVMFGKPVWKVILPISSEAGETRYSVIELIEANTPPALKTADEYAYVGQTVEGVYSKPRGPNWFTIAPELDERTWFAFDAEQLSEVLDLPPAASKPLFEPAELTFTDESGHQKVVRNPYADFHQGDPLPPQRHFGYAITWWGLAIALIVMYFAFHHAQGKLRFRNSS